MVESTLTSERFLVENIIYAEKEELNAYCNGLQGIPFGSEFDSWYRKPWLYASRFLQNILFLKHGIGDYLSFNTIIAGSDPFLMLMAAVYTPANEKILLVIDDTEKAFDRSRMSTLLDDTCFPYFLGKALFGKDVSGSIELLNIVYSRFAEREVGILFNNGDVSFMPSNNFTVDSFSLRVKGSSRQRKLPEVFQAMSPKPLYHNYKRGFFPLTYIGLTILSEKVIFTNATKGLIGSDISSENLLSSYPDAVTFLDGAENTVNPDGYVDVMISNLIKLRKLKNGNARA